MLNSFNQPKEMCLQDCKSIAKTSKKSDFYRKTIKKVKKLKLNALWECGATELMVKRIKNHVLPGHGVLRSVHCLFGRSASWCREKGSARLGSLVHEGLHHWVR